MINHCSEGYVKVEYPSGIKVRNFYLQFVIISFWWFYELVMWRLYKKMIRLAITVETFLFPSHMFYNS